jgi:ABC-type branched-subunit amino acid transport system ATPase component
MSAALLQVEGLVAGHEGSQVLHGVDLEVAPGEVVACMGRNGMGKTTLLRRLMGLLPARGGRIVLAGRDITALPPHALARAGVGYVAQGRDLFDDFTVADNLRLGGLGRGRGKNDLPERLLSWFPILAERRRQRAGTLSGGEQQMLAIARALVGSPRLLLLDEPSEGVQPSMVEEIGRRLGEVVAATGLSLLLVEQNVDLMQTLASRVAFMDRGRIVETCPVAGLAAVDGPLQRHLSL